MRHALCRHAIVPFDDVETGTVPLGPQPRPPNPIDVVKEDVGTDAVKVDGDGGGGAEWSCVVCTFLNVASATECDMCGNFK